MRHIRTDFLSYFYPHSSQSVPHVCQYKDTCRSGKHHSHVPENPAKADQAPCSHQQEKQGKYNFEFQHYCSCGFVGGSFVM